MLDINETASDMIEEALTNSKRFGSLVKEVDHAALGKIVKKFRKQSGVFATDVGRAMGLTKVQINFLESGEKMWDARTLRKYLISIEKLRAQGKYRKDKA